MDPPGFVTPLQNFDLWLASICNLSSCFDLLNSGKSDHFLSEGFGAGFVITTEFNNIHQGGIEWVNSP